MGVRQPNNLAFAPVDFEIETLGHGLEAAGFAFGVPAVFTWIGVSMYLTLQAIEATLTSVRGCAAGSKIAMTYDLPRSSLDTRGLALTNAVRDVAADMANRSSASSSQLKPKRLHGGAGSATSCTSVPMTPSVPTLEADKMCGSAQGLSASSWVPLPAPAEMITDRPDFQCLASDPRGDVILSDDAESESALVAIALEWNRQVLALPKCDSSPEAPFDRRTSQGG